MLQSLVEGLNSSIFLRVVIHGVQMLNVTVPQESGEIATDKLWPIVSHQLIRVSISGENVHQPANDIRWCDVICQ